MEKLLKFGLGIFVFLAGVYLAVLGFRNSTNESVIFDASSILPLEHFAVEKKPEFLAEMPILEQIFSQNHNFTATLSAERLRVLVVTGDIIPARSVNFEAVKRDDFKWAFEKTAEVLKGGDLTFINLESPLIKNCQPTSEGMSFCGDLRNIEGLVWVGVDVANLANNHMGNYSVSGIEQTIDLLTNNGILATGTDGAVIKDVRGMKFAFLGYNEIGGSEKMISWVDEKKIVTEIHDAKRRADITVVAFHWGTEYVSYPSKYQRELAYLAIENGADLVIGNHPHWIQPIEIYKGKLIAYAHGNFIFDQMWSEKTKEGVIGKYFFYDNKLIDVEFLPIVIQNYGQPNFPDSTRKKSILDSMRNESIKLASYPL